MKVSNHKGVDIFVDNEGEFYCHVDNKSTQPHNASFRSPTMGKVQKAIDQYLTDFTPLEVYRLWTHQLKTVKITGKVGGRVFIDGKPKDHLGGFFFPKSVEVLEEFAQMANLCKKVQDQCDIIDAALREKSRLYAELDEVAKKLPRL